MDDDLSFGDDDIEEKADDDEEKKAGADDDEEEEIDGKIDFGADVSLEWIADPGRGG